MPSEKPLRNERMGHDESIGSFLTRLAARSAAPGGGATGALHAAQAAALLAMVARFSDGPPYDAETADATAGAARPPADLMAASVRLVGLAEELLPVANKNVISDIGAAAAAISAAAVTAALNIEANLSATQDPALAAELTATPALADGVTDRAGRVIAAIREEITQ